MEIVRGVKIYKFLPPCNYDKFQRRLLFFIPSNISILISVVTQEEWHQPLVWFIPDQLTDVQATCGPTYNCVLSVSC